MHALVHTWSEKKGVGFPANENASLTTSSPPPLNEENQKLIAPHCVTCKYRMGWVQVSYGLNSVPASVNLYQIALDGFALPCATPLNGWPQSALIGCFWMLRATDHSLVCLVLLTLKMGLDLPGSGAGLPVALFFGCAYFMN